VKKSKSSYITLGVVLALTLLGAFWALYYDPGARELTELQGRLESRQQTLITTRELAAQIPRLEDEIERVTRRIEAITDKLVPSTLTHGEAMAGLKSLADRLGLTFEQIQPIPEEAEATNALGFMQFDVALEGKPSAVYDFLASLERAPVYLIVPGATFTANSKGVRTQVRVLVPVSPSKEVQDGPQASIPQ